MKRKELVLGGVYAILGPNQYQKDGLHARKVEIVAFDQDRQHWPRGVYALRPEVKKDGIKVRVLRHAHADADLAEPKFEIVTSRDIDYSWAEWQKILGARQDRIRAAETLNDRRAAAAASVQEQLARIFGEGYEAPKAGAYYPRHAADRTVCEYHVTLPTAAAAEALAELLSSLPAKGEEA